MINNSKRENLHTGACRNGNFKNYYNFNQPERRTSLLPSTLLKTLFKNKNKLHILDIGCNSGVYFIFYLFYIFIITLIILFLTILCIFIYSNVSIIK